MLVLKKSEQSHILIVDDNPSNILTLEAILKPLNQHLIHAYSGKEALKALLKYDFSVILMDAHMPGLDGFETVKLMRMRDQSRYTPIIFLSAFHRDEIDIAQGYEIGAVDYIIKPINPSILYSKVQVFVDLFTKSIHTQALQTELKKRLQVEKELKQLAQRTQMVLTSAGEGIYGLNAKGIITFANPTAAHILGREVHELVGQSLKIMLSPSKRDENKKETCQKDPLLHALQNNLVYHNDDGIFLKKDGSKIPVEYTISPKQETARCPGAVVVFKDITSRKHAEALVSQHQHQLALAHKSQLSALEEMASALAHELNQPLTSIANYTRGCIRRLHSKSHNTDELLYALEQTASLAERAGKLIHHIKNFARKGKLYYERIDINNIISNMGNLISYEIKNAPIRIHYELLETPLWVMVDKIQLEQVILNLLRNGIEAMNQTDDAQKKQLTIQTGLINENSNNLVEINVIDTGPGFLPDVKANLFNLYFTTKEEGMGMGLSICRTIIEAHGGGISAKDNPAGGALLQITLPLAEET